MMRLPGREGGPEVALRPGPGEGTTGDRRRTRGGLLRTAKKEREKKQPTGTHWLAARTTPHSTRQDKKVRSREEYSM